MVLSLEFYQPFFGYYFFNILLLVLQALHIFWAYLIVRMVRKFVFKGKVSVVKSATGSCTFRGSIITFNLSSKVEGDERSDADSEDDNDKEVEEEPEDEGNECNWEQRQKTSLANNCVLNNLTNQGSITSRLPKAR